MKPTDQSLVQASVKVHNMLEYNTILKIWVTVNKV